MPPAKRAEMKTEAPDWGFLREGMIVNVVTGGRTLTGYEVLGVDANFVKFRGNIQVAPQTEIVLIPFQRIEALGLTDER